MRLPKTLQKHLGNQALLPIQTGYSGAGVYRVAGLILKIQASQNDLHLETQKMQWLEAHHIRVPSVVEYAKDTKNEYLLMTELEGQDASLAEDPKVAVRALAQGLQQLHSLPLDCPFNRSLKITLAEAQKNWKQGLVDESDFDQSRLGTSTKDLYRYLLEQRPSEQLVVTHGDYCLPNIILQQDKSAFIDLGRFGLADAYQDLALMTRSLESEDNPRFHGLVEYFLEVYGLARPDHTKLEYYRILDEFF